MVKPEVIRKRLQKLDEYLTILRRLQRYDLGAFLQDPERCTEVLSVFYSWPSRR